jgi:RHS repeat-associated protein
VLKSGAGVTKTWFLDDGDDEIAEYDSTRNPSAIYVPGPAIDEPIAQVNGAAGVYWYFHTNRQGSVIAMSGGGAAIKAGPFTYDPYGNCFAGSTPCASASSPPAFAFTGRRLDPETGLYYYRARMYSPQLGRFPQTDPVGYTADLNLYTYVGNDPTNMTDPYGEAPEQCTTDDNGNTTCTGDIETVVVTAQRPPPPPPKAPPARTAGAGAIAMPLSATGARAAAGALPELPELGILGPLGVVIGAPLLTCGDSPCSPTINEAKQKPPRADKGKERGKKEALKQFRTNKDFRQWFHRNFKGGPGGQGIPAGNTRNPDLGEDAIQDAWEEYQQQGGR